MKLIVGQKAPDFELPDQDGNLHKSSDFLGQTVLIYFYPKDDTPGCTIEACGIRDNFPKFSEIKVKVLGISVDTVASHKKFADKYKLPFTLLSDSEKQVVNLYDVWKKKKFMGREYDGTVRTSFLINKEGKIIKIFENVKPPIHAQQILEEIKSNRSL